MIEQVRIKNLGVIRDATLDLSPGLTVLTGETGAGKTMVFRSLSAVFGAKADAALVSTGELQAVVEVDAVLTDSLVSEVEELGAALDDGNVAIISRHINVGGRSRSFIGGVSVPSSVVSDLGEQLVAVHGQSEQLRLTKASQQRIILDRFGSTSVLSVLHDYQELWSRAQQLRQEISDLTLDEAARERELEKLNRHIATFDKLKPEMHELDALDDEASRLGNSEVLYAASIAAVASLEGDDADQPHVLSLLSLARKSLEREQAHDAALTHLVSRVREVEVLAADVAADVAAYVDAIDASPARLDYVETRRAALRKASRDFDTLEEFIEWVTTNRSRLAQLSGGDEAINDLRAELSAVLDDARVKAGHLTAARQKAAHDFAHKVSQELESLAMPGARVEFSIAETELGLYGADDITLGLVSRPDSPLVPIAKGASGGELSRIMLAVEVVLASADPIGTFVFDEVDAGVGGAAAVEVGKRLAHLARTSQVVVVTHLPQVAAFGDKHLVVAREADEQVHSSSIGQVTGDARVTEISRMLAGLTQSQAGTQLAEELLALASDFKASL